MSCNNIIITQEAVAADPYWNNVVFLTHFDGSRGDWHDVRGHELVPASSNWNGITTETGRFGGAAKFTASRMSALLNPDEVIGTGDFTVEFFFYFYTDLSAPAAMGLFELGDSRNGAGIRLRINASEQVQMWDTQTQTASWTTTASFNNWHHVAVTRKDGVLTLWLNGKPGNRSTINTSDISDGRIGIGTNHSLSTTSYTGRMDEIRITRGVARYTEEFAPPTEPF